LKHSDRRNAAAAIENLKDGVATLKARKDMIKPTPDSLHIWPQCRSCILGMVRDAFSMMKTADAAILQQVNDIAEGILSDAFEKGWPSPVTANRILAEQKRLTGVADPYVSFKKRELEQAHSVYSQLKAHVGRDLRSRIVLSVLGNSLDFFTNSEETLQALPDVMHRGISFYHDDIDRLERFLVTRPHSVLFFTDNSGEVFFDIPFFQYIRDHAREVTLIVKGKPTLNDLSRIEIANERLESFFGDVADTGTAGVGIDWDLTSAAFRDRVQAADLIVSKGMANFETVYPKNLSAHVFFLLKSKCRPIQDYLSTPSAGYCALWKEGFR
jgi:uncharacterized protein with ATP-grasp and redox domains